MSVARAFFAIFTNVSFVEIIITQIKHPRAESSWVMKIYHLFLSRIISASLDSLSTNAWNSLNGINARNVKFPFTS